MVEREEGWYWIYPHWNVPVWLPAYWDGFAFRGDDDTFYDSPRDLLKIGPRIEPPEVTE